MCGIAGFARKDLGEAHLSRMLDRLQHRGPDDRGTFEDDQFALGNTLLAIVDIGNGRQPFIRELNGEKFVTVFNGEIYNYRELRRQLLQEGIRFTTDCDTEVVLAAYAAWGESAVSKFDGQWAFAVWESKKRRLFLSRDPFGIKPLYYFHSGDFFAFASEPKALFSLPPIAKQPNLSALREYFLHGFAFAAGYSLNHRSFFNGIDSLPPGHSLTWRRGENPAIRRYFDYPISEPLSGTALEEVGRMLGQAVIKSTEASMMGDAPVGVALSGGIDSSVITAIAARAGARQGKSPLLTSCIAYGQSLNEDATASGILHMWLASQQAPINLVYSKLEHKTYLDDVDEMIYHFDEPHWEVKQLAMFNNYRELKRHGAKVVLTGEGADELFFGYYHRFPGFKNPVIQSVEAFRHVWGARLNEVQSLLAGSEKKQLKSLMNEALERFYAPFVSRGVDPDRCMQCWYLATFLHWLLIDNDRCSMAFSLEGRFPFLNRAVYELAFRIPASRQLGGDLGQEKLVLREAFKNLVPEPIWLHRKKAPLPSPLRLAFHARIRDALDVAISNAATDTWEVVNRDRVLWIAKQYAARIKELEKLGGDDSGGESLISYLRLDEPWSVRTPHVFGLLTFFRWWKMNFD